MISREKGVKIKLSLILQNLGAVQVATFNTSGMADVLALFEGGKALFIEVKKDVQGKYTERGNQKLMREKLTHAGFKCIVVDQYTDLGYTIKEALK